MAGEAVSQITEAAHHGGVDLIAVVVLLAAAVIAVPLFRRAGLGSVLGYLAAGLAIGPFGLGLFHDAQSIIHVAELGVVPFLFIIGLEMQPSRLWAMRGEIFGLGLLQLVNMRVAPGEVVGLIGPSGSGKSTLLKALGAVIDPSGGRMTLGDELIYDDGWKIRDLRALRRDKIGFVFQAPYLIPFLDVTDNVALLPMLAGIPNHESRQRARELLKALDVEHRADAMPSQLSGGEQQRVAIARGLVNRPPVILADEPTAPLDSVRALTVIRILNDMAVKFGTAIIVVTHDEKIIPTFRRIYHIRDGVTHEEAGEGRGFETGP
ncbi:ABC transporter ATP-binding protein [Agrobacterium pusense]|uniref:ABC transporter ATP-binding protein n=1 Tax=Agrobacterium pusense TaxID=648995 RepID=UPI0028994FB3|nr:ATP-binding cassette domain-containing protein [Agrobacterium pusense]